MKKLVYVETTIPSFYFEVRSEASMIARRDWTREWWEIAIDRDELVTSEAVIEELTRGNFPTQSDCLKLMENLPLLPIETAVADIVETYIDRGVMPQNPAGDALHLALASHHDCQFLATWNCTHLANANKFDHIRRVNVLIGVSVPAIVTPLELLGEKNDG